MLENCNDMSKITRRYFRRLTKLQMNVHSIPPFLSENTKLLNDFRLFSSVFKNSLEIQVHTKYQIIIRPKTVLMRIENR